MDAKGQYVKWCDGQHDLPIFFQPWWLDAASGSYPWNVALAKTDEMITGVHPYMIKHRLGMRILTQPKLTQYLGPWIVKLNSDKKSALQAHEKRVMQSLISSLPQFDLYRQSWSPKVMNWLPFYWQSFEQTTRYTMQLNHINDSDFLWRNLQDNAKSDKKKAEGRFSLTVDKDASLEEFIILNKLVFARQKISVPYDDEIVFRIDDACKKRGCRAIVIARGPDGKAHAGAYIIWDQTSAYYLMGGGDPELRNSGAMTLCLWESIKLASANVDVFDFEGSMMEPVERFFRSFGANHVPYHHVSKIQNKMVRVPYQIWKAIQP